MQSAYHKTILKNGMTILTQPVASVRSVALGVFVQSGVNDESPENNGIAHFLEHMSFKSTPTRNAYDIVEDIESHGGNINAYTSREMTAYYTRILDTELDTALEVLSDIVLNSTYPQKEIEREKTVVFEEIRDSLDTPQDVAYDAFYKMMFPDHPYGYPILGSIDTVGTFTTQKLRDFADSYYSPGRIIIAAAGSVQHADLVKKTESLMGGDDGENTPHFIPAIPQQKEKEFVLERDIAQCHFITGRRALGYSDERRHSYMILNAILSAGMSSRLFHNIRERYGFAYTIYSFIDAFEHTGLFGIYTATDKKHVEKLRELIWKELNKLKSTPITEKELNKVKNQAKGSLVMGLESMHNRMERMLQQYIRYGMALSIDESLRRIEAVTPGDILKLSNELFDEDFFHSLLLQPKRS